MDGAINYERGIILRSVRAYNAPFFMRERIRSTHTTDRIGRLQPTNNARCIELVNFNIIRSASVLFICEVTLLSASCIKYTRGANE